MSAAPILANVVQIKVDGMDIATTVMDNLKSVEVESSMHLPSMAVLTFHDPNLTLIDGTTFGLGKALEISMGTSTSAIAVVFKGEVVVQEPSFEDTFTALFVVRAYDKLHRLNRIAKTRTRVQAMHSDLVTTICGEAGLVAQVTSTAVVHPIIWQDNQTDLAFLHQLARLNGMAISLDDTTLSFKTPTAVASGVTAIWGENLREFSPRLSLVQKPTGVTVKGWDIKTKQAVTATAQPVSNDNTTGITQTFTAAAQTAFTGTAIHIEPLLGVTAPMAQKVANSILSEANAGYLQAEGRMMGDGRMKAGKTFIIQKVGTRFSGTYRATVVRHVFRGGEFETYFRVEGKHPDDPFSDLGEPVVAPLVNAWTGVYPAVVTNITDPDNLMRVKVKFPWLDDQLESDWCAVVLPAGVMATPSVNDQVAVVFEQGNFNRPYVLGELYSTTSPGPSNSTNGTASGKVIQQIIKTENGHAMTFQDKAGQEKIAIASSDGQMKIEMDITNKKVTVQSAADVLVKATANMTLEATGSMTVKGATVKVEATGQMDLTATGVANLKGSMVNIN
jgi:phage protein D/phage baseplate assembly protein gpV